MRLIDGEALIHELNNSHYPGAPYIDAGISIAIGKVCDAPTIEPKIVRCKNCKYNSNTCGNYVNCDIIPQMFGRTADNFCSMAERRTDEE